MNEPLTKPRSNWKGVVSENEKNRTLARQKASRAIKSDSSWQWPRRLDYPSATGSCFRSFSRQDNVSFTISTNTFRYKLITIFTA